MSNPLIKKTVVALALAMCAGAASAQTYSAPSQSDQLLVQILQSVVGGQYQTNTRYRDREHQEVFRQADTNHDGRLSQREIDVWRDNRYGNRNDDRYDRRGIPVSRIDTNRDGYVSRSEQQAFLRLIDRSDRDWR